MMTGPGRPVRQPANTRASVLLTCFLRLAAVPCMPEPRAFIRARGGGDRERRTPRARPIRTIPSAAFQGRFQLPRHDPVGGSAGRSVVHTPREPGNWAPASRPVRGVGGVYTGRRYDVVRTEGAQGGDGRSAVTGAGRGWRGVPGAGRVLPAGTWLATPPGCLGPPRPRRRRAR